jgi:hypothetical protein
MTSRWVVKNKRTVSARDGVVEWEIGGIGGIGDESGDGGGRMCGGLSEDEDAGVAGGGGGRVDAFGLCRTVWRER